MVPFFTVQVLAKYWTGSIPRNTEVNRWPGDDAVCSSLAVVADKMSSSRSRLPLTSLRPRGYVTFPPPSRLPRHPKSRAGPELVQRPPRCFQLPAASNRFDSVSCFHLRKRFYCCNQKCRPHTNAIRLLLRWILFFLLKVNTANPRDFIWRFQERFVEPVKAKGFSFL